MSATRTSIAAGRIPYGSPVEVDGATCSVCSDLARMSGIARRGGAWDDAYDEGEVVHIQTEGGIKMVVPQNTELTFNGIQMRLLANDSPYVTLSGGKIVAC